MSSHRFPPDGWRCVRCGALAGTVDAALRCDAVFTHCHLCERPRECANDQACGLGLTNRGGEAAIVPLRR